jgi:LPXTG-motif cell wall-anchored protein
MRGGARATSSVAALLLVILSFGVAGAAYADPGGNGNAYGADNGNGADNGKALGASNGSGGTAVAAAASGSSSTTSGSSAKSSTSKGSTKSSSSKSTSTGKSSGNGKSTASDHKTKGTAGTSGDVKSPQPISGADDNTGGANGQCTGGVYCSTRDGSASGNGNGGGKATGKPCAGCVGKADNKNPQGQKPGPQDHNNGYECDGNNGIAKTNPAHTGCKPGTPPCVGAGCNPPPPPCVGAGCNPPVVCPPGTVLVNGACVAGQEEILCPDGSVMPESGVCPSEEEVSPPTVLGEEAFRPKPNAQVQGVQAGVLPATGSSSGIGLLAGVGFALLALGAGVMMRRRTA